MQGQQRDSEYINVDTPGLLGEGGNYVNTNPVAQQSTGESYVNFKPASHSGAKHSHEAVTEYIDVSTPDDETLLSDNFGKPLHTGHIKSERQEETDGHISTDHDGRKALTVTEKAHRMGPPDNNNTAPKVLPSTNAEQTVNYENIVPLRTSSASDTPLTSEYVKLVTVSIGHTEPGKGHKENVTIKTPPPSTADIPPSPEMAATSAGHTKSAEGYEDFVPINTTANIPLATVSIGQTEPAKGYKEIVTIKTPPATADVQEMAGMSVSHYPQTQPPTGYEDFVPIKTPPSTADIPQPSEIAATSVSHYPQTQPAATGYEDFVPIKTPPSTADTPLPSDYVVMTPNSPQTKLVEGYEDSTKTDNPERHSTEENIDGEYSQLQFRSKEDPPISEQNDSTYSRLSHPSANYSNTHSFYSKLEISEVSKAGFYDRASSLEGKPQVPSRNLKKPIKLYEPSSNFTTVIPPLPPRNRTVQKAADSPSPPPAPPAGPKPVMSPTCDTPPTTPTIGPKPNSHSPQELKYCEIEFTDIGQPKFRARSKVIDQTLPSQHDAYAIIDRDASVGLQLALEQKKHGRR